jgi:hypothetical protein
MFDIKNPTFWLVGVLTLGSLWFVGRARFNTEARERRRREKSHRRVISRKQGPAVKLAVKVDKPPRDRKN